MRWKVRPGVAAATSTSPASYQSKPKLDKRILPERQMIWHAQCLAVVLRLGQRCTYSPWSVACAGRTLHRHPAGVSEKPLRNRISTVLAEIGAADRAQAALLAHDLGLTAG